MAFVGVALLGLTIAFAVVGHYTRRVTAAGVLLPRDGLLNLSSNVVGIVAKCAAEEGQKVQKGELLFVIDREANSVSGPTVRRVIDSLGQQKALLQQQRDLAMTAARSEKDQLQAQILNQQAQHAELAQRIATGTESMRELKEVRAKLEAAKKKQPCYRKQLSNSTIRSISTTLPDWQQIDKTICRSRADLPRRRLISRLSTTGRSNRLTKSTKPSSPSSSKSLTMKRSYHFTS